MFAKHLIFASLVAVVAAPAIPAAAQSGTPPQVPAATGQADAGPQSKSRRGRGDISTEELQGASVTDAYSAVSRLRPNWLRVRGQSSISRAEYVKVYQDGILLGPPSTLRQISAEAIQRISYLDGMAATQRFGTDHGNGAILVEIRR